MIIACVFLGAIAGATAGIVALFGTGSVLYSLLIYSAFGSLSVLMVCSLTILSGWSRTKVGVADVPVGMPRLD